MQEINIRPRHALLSVYDKTGLEELVRLLHNLEVKLYASGGTATFIEGLGLPVVALESITNMPSILGGRVKTLHPSIFGGILAIRGDATHEADRKAYSIPEFDLVIVDLYPFEQTLKKTDDVEQIIEQIDIGGVALIRAAAKNFSDVAVIPSAKHYATLVHMLKGGATSFAQRRELAGAAFALTSRYDTAIAAWFAGTTPLRYGENPHQSASFRGNLEALFTQRSGKALSYNNLLDVDSALRLIAEFAGSEAATCAIIKHTNPCGVATRATASEAWSAALASDPVSAFGGIIVLNHAVDLATAEGIQPQFFEVLLAPAYAPDAFALLAQKKNRILLEYHSLALAPELARTILTGTLIQQADNAPTDPAQWQTVTTRKPTPDELRDLVFAEKVAKHLKSNAIALVRAGQVVGVGMGQTSRVEALEQALAKAAAHNFEINSAVVLASDGFFPFPDSVEIAYRAGIHVVLQPGGSVRDPEVTAFAEAHHMCMVLTGTRHFRH